MNPTRTTLPSLPLELLQQIAACVEVVHRPSLYAFGLTNKALHTASVFLIFRQINITVHNREGLQRDADRLIEAFSRTDSARHVQTINVQDALRLKAKRGERIDQATTSLKHPDHEQMIFEEESTNLYGEYVVYDPVIEKSSEEDVGWAPVVRLLESIPHLRDLIYDCKSQFAPSLLSTLRSQHPQCRLHHLTFRFRTLLWGVPYPYEMELATFPSLYRVRLACAPRDSDGDDDFNLEALMELAAGLAPNLKEVDIVTLYPTRSAGFRRPRASWQGLPGFTGDSVGSLTSLSLKGCSDLRSPTLLEDWARHTDFAYLQHLTLGGRYAQMTSPVTGETMIWVAQNHVFPQLRTLVVDLTRNDGFEEKPHYVGNAISFFRAFPALEELSIHGPIDSRIMDVILSHHGPKLKKFTFRPVSETNRPQPQEIPLEFTKDRIQQIQSQCPVLEELAIPFRRNMSNASETAMYRCFSEMASLRSLFLTLDCSNQWDEPGFMYENQFDGEDEEPLETVAPLKRGHLKATFINCAVDEALARSIWKTISQGKTGRKLERLKLWTYGGFDHGGQPEWTIRPFLKVLSGSWLIERIPRDDQDDITIRELAPHAREIGDPLHVTRCYESEVGQLFRSIWPSKEGSEDWQEDWSSFPLEG